jgi:RNA polymerase sigma factor (sigma-70 family)
MTPPDYINKHYNEIKQYLRGVTLGENNSLYEDFIHEVIMIFLDHPSAQQSIDTGTVRFFITRIALNQWRSVNSKFHYKYRKNSHTSELKDTVEINEYQAEDDILINNILQILEHMFQNNRRLEAMVIVLKHTLKTYAEVGRKLNMRPTTVRKVYLRGIKQIKKHVRRNNININNSGSVHSNNVEQLPLSVISQIFKTKYFESRE